jgi:iron complex transport system ATP-binding protein
MMLQTCNLQLKIGDRMLVSGLDWQIQAGECWCVIGPNGAGKSTLLRTLANLRQPDGGTVQLNGKSLTEWDLKALARERAFLPQQCSDAFGYRVIDIVLIARHPYHDTAYWESEVDVQVAYDALQRLNIAHLAKRDARTLSGGERQRVLIAAVLAQDTPLLLLDEPTNALDLAHQVSVMRLLESLCKNADKAVVMISHDLNLAQSVASHALLLMGDGQWQAGTAAEVMCASTLSRCLGHPIETVRHGNRIIHIPSEL